MLRLRAVPLPLRPKDALFHIAFALRNIGSCQGSKRVIDSYSAMLAETLGKDGNFFRVFPQLCAMAVDRICRRF
ncbi:hypothetical protein B0G69_8075 [Paraburkholderia sp. RAU2J]|nr:hypothetical protein B0G69_8075 [Paraburkholderia sp. RAU2J]